MNSFFRQPMSLTATIRLVILVVAVLVLIPVLIFIAYPWYQEWVSSMMPSETATEDVVIEPTGHILLNLTPTGGEPGLYEFNLKTGFLNRFSDSINFPHFTDDESSYISVAAVSSSTTSGEKDVWINIYNIGTDTGRGTLLMSAPEDEIGTVRHPRISSLGDYYSYEVTPTFDGVTVDEYYLDNWKIYLGEMNNPASHVTNGAYVNFAPDASDGFLYIKSDGVYHYYPYADTEQLVFGMESGTMAANNHFRVSPDHSRFAFTNVGAGEVTVATIERWNPFTISEIVTYELDAFWPVFSPDGRYLAVQEVDAGEIGEELTNSRLTIIDLETSERETVADLSGYVQMQLFINDWINSEPEYE